MLFKKSYTIISVFIYYNVNNKYCIILKIVIVIYINLRLYLTHILTIKYSNKYKIII